MQIADIQTEYFVVFAEMKEGALEHVRLSDSNDYEIRAIGRVCTARV